jgi:hypothetical protein
MIVTNQTTSDIYFGPLHLGSGVGTQLTVDDTTSTSLYLTDDGVAEALNNAYLTGKVTVSGQAQPFPRPTGTPQLLHGTGNPEGLIFAPQGSVYMRRDGTGANNLYCKTTGVTLSTGWQNYTTSQTGPGTTYRKTTAKAATNTTSETDLLNGEITIGASVLSATTVMRLTAWGDGVWNSGAIQLPPRFKFKMGSTVLLDTSVGTATSVGNSATRGSWRAVIEVMNLGATNVQLVKMQVIVAFGAAGTQFGIVNFATGTGQAGTMSNNVGGFYLAEGYNSGAIDTTAAQALAFTVINGSATSTEFKLLGALVEII